MPHSSIGVSGKALSPANISPQAPLAVGAEPQDGGQGLGEACRVACRHRRRRDTQRGLTMSRVDGIGAAWPDLKPASGQFSHDEGLGAGERHPHVEAVGRSR